MSRKRSFALLHWIACCMAVQFSLPSCASYQGKPARTPLPENMPYSYNDNRVEIYADPYVQLERQREYFDDELAKSGVLPIQVVIRNKTETELVVPYAGIWLELTNGTQIARSDLAKFMMAKSPWKKETLLNNDPAWTPVPTDPDLLKLAGPLLVVTAPVWVPIVVVLNRSKQAWQDRVSDYVAKELNHTIVLKKDDATNGFIFFVSPTNVDFTRLADLVFSFEQPSFDNRTLVRIHLKDLGPSTNTGMDDK